MSATSLAPMMCYKHPNGLRSVLKYPNIICGSDEHTAMLVIGWILLVVFVLGFVALCTFAVIQVRPWWTGGMAGLKMDKTPNTAMFLGFLHIGGR